MLRCILAIARNTFTQALRQKFLRAVFLLVGVILAATLLLAQVDFNAQELKMLGSFSVGCIGFFGTILAIVLSSQLFFTELEHRTLITLLAKSVRRFEFIVGKFLGIMMLLAVFITITLGITSLILLSCNSDLPPDESISINYVALLCVGLVKLLKWGIIAAMTLCVATLAGSNVFTILASAMALMVCETQLLLKQWIRHADDKIYKPLLQFFDGIFPDLNLLDVPVKVAMELKDPNFFQTIAEVNLTIAQSFLKATQTTSLSISGMLIYTLVYIVAFNVAASVFFRKRSL